MSKQPPLDDRCSPWPWSQVATMSSGFKFIRRIEDDEGNVVAQVRYVADDKCWQTTPKPAQATARCTTR